MVRLAYQRLENGDVKQCGTIRGKRADQRNLKCDRMTSGRPCIRTKNLKISDHIYRAGKLINTFSRIETRALMTLHYRSRQSKLKCRFLTSRSGYLSRNR